MLTKKQQIVEGKLRICPKENCPCSCCDDDEVQEWAIEFFAFHEKIKELLKENGIKIKFIKDRVFFKNCSDGKQCKFLKYSPNKNIDPRPIDCKIYPYAVDWETIDFDKKVVNLYFWDNECPIANKNIPKSFQKSVKKILSRDFTRLFNGAKFTFTFNNKIFPAKRKKLQDYLE